MNQRQRKQIEADIEVEARKIGDLLQEGIARYNAVHPDQPDIGFALAVFEFGPPGGFLTYISNAEGENMIAMLRELIMRVEVRQGLDDLDVK